MTSLAVPLHFGARDRRLFGVYHSPDHVASDHAVLICQPVGLDYIRSYRVFRRLAETLAKGGCHVFRFDYFGCGDSDGKGDESTLPDWLGDAQLAAEELRDMSGATRISLIGTRLGGAVATLLAGRGAGFCRLALWDPVVRGAEYLDRMTAVHRGMIADQSRFVVPPSPCNDGRGSQLLGFPMTPPQREAIAAVDLNVESLASVKQVLILISDERPDFSAYAATLRKAGVNTTLRHMPGVGDWDELSCIEQVLVPGVILPAIAKWILEGS
jgi:pimeloyl-ACP methyl ester carboxylesterase